MVPVNELDEKKLHEYLALIDIKLDAAGRKDLSCLNDTERTTLMGYLFALDISNGGMEKFFLERGDVWRETLEAIKAVNATCLADLFEEGLSLFPGGIPASNYDTRHDQLMASGGLGKDGHEGQLWKLTGDYYRLQAASPENCLYQRLTEFAIKQLVKPS